MAASIINSIKWNTFGSVSALFIRFTLNIILARLLMPDDFGLLALVFSITSFSDIIINSGLKTSIVKEKNITNQELRSINNYNIGFGIIFFIVIYFCSTFIANFYNNPILENIVKVLSVLYLIKSIYLVPFAVLEKDAEFKTIAICNFVASIVAGTCSIIMAIKDYGVWSLVALNLITHIILLIGFYSCSTYKYGIHFSYADIKKHLKFGVNIFASRILMQLSDKIDYLLLGKLVPIQLLGFYNKGKEFAMLPSKLTTGITSKSYFTHASKLPLEGKINTYVKINYLFLFLTLPLFIAIFTFADIGFYIVLGEKWMSSVPFFRAILVYSFITQLYSLNTYLCYARNDSKTPLYAFIVSIVLKFGIIFAGYLWIKTDDIIYVIIFSMIISGIVYGFVSLDNLRANKKIITFFKHVAICFLLAGMICYGLFFVQSFLLKSVFLVIALVAYYKLLTFMIGLNLFNILKEIKSV